MYISSEITFKLRDVNGIVYRVARTDIGNLEALNIVYEFPILESSPLASSSTVMFKGSAMQVVTSCFNRHDKAVYLEVEHPDIPDIVTYSIAMESIKFKLGYLECSLVLWSLYGELANLKASRYDIDVNALQKYTINLPESKGFNRMLYASVTPEGPLELVNNICYTRISQWSMTPYRSLRLLLNYGPQHLPVSLHKAEVVNKDVFLTSSTTPGMRATSTGPATPNFDSAEFATVLGQDMYVPLPNQLNTNRFTDNLFFTAYTSNRATRVALTTTASQVKFNLHTTMYRRGGNVAPFNINVKTNIQIALHSFIHDPNTFSNDKLGRLYEEVYTTTVTQLFATTNNSSTEQVVPITANIPALNIELSPYLEDERYIAYAYSMFIDVEITKASETVADVINDLTFGVGYSNLSILESNPLLINFEYDALFKARSVVGYKIADVLRAGINKMLDHEKLALGNVQTSVQPFKSDGIEYDLMLISGEALKNKNNRLFYFKLQDFIETMYGIGYQLFSGPESVRFALRKEAQREVITLDEVGEYGVSYSNLLYNTFEVGYNIDETSSGKIDPGRRAVYKTPVLHKAETASRIIPYRADALGLLKFLDSLSSKDSIVDDTWWGSIGSNNSGVSEAEAIDTTIFLVVAKYSSSTGLLAVTTGAPTAMTKYRLFNWFLSTAGLLYMYAPLLKESGRFLELTSSFGLSAGVVRPSASEGGIMFGPVADLYNAGPGTFASTTEAYGPCQIQANVKMSYADFVRVLLASRQSRNVYINIPSIPAFGLLLNAKVDLVFENSVDIVMLTTPSANVASVLPSKVVIPASRTFIKPLHAGGPVVYDIFLNSVEPLDLAISVVVYKDGTVGSYPITGQVVLTGLHSYTMRYVKLTVNIDSLSPGAYEILIYNNGIQYKHNITITQLV